MKKEKKEENSFTLKYDLKSYIVEDGFHRGFCVERSLLVPKIFMKNICFLTEQISRSIFFFLNFINFSWKALKSLFCN